MKRWNKITCMSAAVAAIIVSGQKSMAQVLQWDASGNSAPSYTDGGGIWDTTTPHWVDNTGTEVAWANGSSAVFGNPSPSASVNGNTPYEIDLQDNVTTQDITLGTGSDGTPYAYITDFQGGSLTVNGNITKVTGGGNLQFDMYTTNLTLGPGNHTIGANDTSGDAAPEIAFNGSITGSGNVIIDNGSFAQWGTTAFVYPDSYTGSTLINKGRLVIGDVNSLNSSSGTTIANQGTLSIGGDIGKLLTSQNENFVVTEPITITRNTYTGADYSDYPDALISANTGQPDTVVSFPNLTIDSTDARIAAQTSTIAMNTPLVAAADVNGTAMADFDGDFAGYVDLNADNTAFCAAGNAIGILGGVEINASTLAELGGTGSKLVLSGGFLHITSALVASDPNIVNNFGAGTSHTINTSAVSTGVDIDPGQTFTVNGLSGGGVGSRGGGTLNFAGTNTFTGTPYFDGVSPGQTDTTATGVVNYMAGSTTTQVGLRVRSATVNVAGTVNVGGTYSSIGADSGGSNGTPDYATVNISGSGSVIENSGDDFNVSDNANTHGTINLSGNGNLTVGGQLFIAKSSGAVGTVSMQDNSTLNSNSLVFVGQNDGTGTFTQNGGAINLTRNGNFTFVVDDGRGGTGAGSGTYNLNGGSLTSAGEIYVGEGAHGNGTWNQTGGTVNFSNWFVVGREGGLGTVNISGGTMTKTGTVGADPGSQFSMGEGGSKVCTMTVSGTGVFVEQAGEFYVGNNSSVGVLNIGTAAGAATNADATASVTVNNWFAVGRSGASTGTVNIYDGTLTQATANWFDISGDGGSSTGTVNVYGGTLNALQMYLGENGSGHATLNINGGSVNITNNSIFANGNSVTGTLNLNGGTLTAYGFQAHNGGGTGSAIFDWNGGTLVEGSNNTTGPLVGAAVTSIVSAGGAIINTNGFSPSFSTALTHDSGVSGPDGGLTKLGTGTLTSSGNNTYTGPTIVKAGTLAFTGTPTFANGEPLNLAGGGATITLSHGLTGYLGYIKAAYDNGAWDGTSSATPYITSSFAHTHPGTGVGYAVSSGALTLTATWLGDTNLDGTLTAADISAMTPMSSGATWANGDFNYDGAVNADDYALAQLGLAESAGKNITAVAPEPAMFLALPLLVGLMPRRSRRRA